MAGRRGDFVYTADDGSQYCVLIDASNAEIASLGFGTYSGNPVLSRPPRGLKLRKLVAVNADTGIERKISCGSPNSDAWLGVTKYVELIDFNDGITKQFRIEKRIEERFHLPPKTV